MAIAAFDYAAWVLRYPEFGAVSAERAALFFAEAGLYLDNTDASPITDVTYRGVLLNMLTAHVAALSGALEADGKPSGLVGRVSSASEGQVSVSVDGGMLPASAAWYAQTPYGLAYWQATKRQRGAAYVPPAPYNFEPWGVSPWRR